jgi:hypothetical protein
VLGVGCGLPAQGRSQLWEGQLGKAAYEADTSESGNEEAPCSSGAIQARKPRPSKGLLPVLPPATFPSLHFSLCSITAGKASIETHSPQGCPSSGSWDIRFQAEQIMSSSRPRCSHDILCGHLRLLDVHVICLFWSCVGCSIRSSKK